MLIYAYRYMKKWTDQNWLYQIINSNQYHAKTYHQCQFVCSGCNTCNSSIWRNFFSVYKRKASTIRAFDNVPTCLHHCVMTVQVSHHNPLCSPSLVGESANTPTDTTHYETLKHLHLPIRVKQKHCSSFVQTKNNKFAPTNRALHRCLSAFSLDRLQLK